MIKFIGNWMFTSHIFHDAEPSPVAINMRDVSYIDEQIDDIHGKHVIICLNNETQIPIEGDTIEILAAFQNHLLETY